MLKILLITIAVVAAAFCLLAVRIILKRGGRFSSQHIAENKLMRDRGIGCATSQDRKQQKENRNKLNLKEL